MSVLRIRPTTRTLPHFSIPPVRRYATELPRPSPANQPIPETFSDTSRRRPYPIRELPREKVVETTLSNATSNYSTQQPRWPIFLTALVLGVAGWSAFMLVATNQEKLSSSVFRSIVRALKADSELKDVLGDAIRPQPEWYLNGDPLVKGHIGQLQGNIDVSFRVKGSKGSGTVYFTSIRREKGVPFKVLRFRVICDDGRTVNVADSAAQENNA